jgi:hypothetical protein
MGSVIGCAACGPTGNGGVAIVIIEHQNIIKNSTIQGLKRNLRRLEGRVRGMVYS